MAPVELGPLRAQINYLFQHFSDAEFFTESLLLFLERYKQKKGITNSWLGSSTSLPVFNSPQILITEILTTLEGHVQSNPDSALLISELLWKQKEYEPKMLAYQIIYLMPEKHTFQVLSHLEKWIEENPDDYLVTQMVAACFNRETLILSDRFLISTQKWLLSRDIKHRKIGIKALETLAKSRSFTNLPYLFQLTEYQIASPIIEIRKDLLALIWAFIERSEAETAAFLISISQIHQEKNLLAFVRKCYPLFSDFYREEIQAALPI